MWTHYDSDVIGKRKFRVFLQRVGCQEEISLSLSNALNWVPEHVIYMYLEFLRINKTAVKGRICLLYP